MSTERDCGSEPCREADPRPRTPDTPEEWMAKVREENGAVMLEADDQTVFVAYVKSDKFDGQEGTWVGNSIDHESGYRTNAYSTESLVETWFHEAVPRGRAFEMDVERTPLGGSQYVA